MPVLRTRTVGYYAETLYIKTTKQTGAYRERLLWGTIERATTQGYTVLSHVENRGRRCIRSAVK